MISIKLESLTKKYENAVAIDRVDLEINKGEIIGLIGPDGAGKTTLLRLAAGLLRPSSGSILVEGIDVVQNPTRIKEHIGYMPQHFSLYGDLSVRENMKFFADLYGVPKADFLTRKSELLAFSGLTPFEDRLARNLSGGMQKKLGLASNLFHTPKLLLLDEPTTGVDPVSRKELWDILFELNRQGVTLLITTPYMDEAQRCHKVGLIHQGRILSFQTPRSLVEAMTEEVIELILEDKEARKKLVRLTEVKNIYSFGEALHLIFEPGTNAEEKTREFLKGQGIQVVSQLKRIAPSLEDVFIGLIIGQTEL